MKYQLEVRAYITKDGPDCPYLDDANLMLTGPTEDSLEGRFVKMRIDYGRTILTVDLDELKAAIELIDKIEKKQRS